MFHQEASREGGRERERRLLSPGAGRGREPGVASSAELPKLLPRPGRTRCALAPLVFKLGPPVPSPRSPPAEAELYGALFIKYFLRRRTKPAPSCGRPPHPVFIAPLTFDTAPVPGLPAACNRGSALPGASPASPGWGCSSSPVLISWTGEVGGGLFSRRPPAAGASPAALGLGFVFPRRRFYCGGGTVLLGG